MRSRPKVFVADLAERLANRVQLTSDGHKPYLQAVDDAFGAEVDYAMRRFPRLTNGFSKKVENHVCAVALHYVHYNFGRIHKTLRITPAMGAGISDHVWSLEEIAPLAN